MDTYRSASLVVSRPRAWQSTAIALAVYAVWLLVVYRDTVVSMVSIWYRSETFAHGFLVFPISAWLVWRQRARLAQLEPSPAAPAWAIVALVAAGTLWSAGELADVLAARHFAWVTMLIVGISMLVGPRVARTLLFPLAFLYFAVPIGEFLLPTLIEWTANFTIAALRASGVPVWREGMTFQIPTGAWSVAEACSGLRYLIASITVGALYAYIAYRSPLRRAAFVVASIVVPIIANWLRAYMIVMIGHLSGNKLAVGIDHIIYGWIFFGLVMLLLFWAGSLWREDDEVVPEEPDDANAGDGAGRRLSLSRALVVALVLTAAPAAAIRLLHETDFRGHVDTSAPALPGWQALRKPIVTWTPEFLPPRATIAETYRRGGDEAGLFVALYFNQDAESKLVSSTNVLVNSARDHTGYTVSDARREIDVHGAPLAFDEQAMRFVDGRIVARRWYWVDGEYTASAARAKLLQARSRLLGRGDAGAIVVVYARIESDTAAVPAGLDDMTREAAVALKPLLAQQLHAVAR